MNLSKSLYLELKSLYVDGGVERGGFLTSERVVECENDHINKIEGFSFTFEDLDLIENESPVALFHTHPNGSSTMSMQDFAAFLNYPQYLHLIVGKNGLSCYKVTENETVVIEEILVDED